MGNLLTLETLEVVGLKKTPIKNTAVNFYQQAVKGFLSWLAKEGLPGVWTNDGDGSDEVLRVTLPF